MQMYTTTMTQPDPQVFMEQFTTGQMSQKANKWASRNLLRWSNAEYDATFKAAQVELDPVKRAAMFIKMNDLVVNDDYVIPLFARPAAASATVNKLVAAALGLGQRHLGPGLLEPGGLSGRDGLSDGRRCSACCNYILRRLLIALPSLLGISVVLFTVLALAPGDPFEDLANNPNVPPEVRMALRAQFGLDDPVWQRYCALAVQHAPGRLGLLLRQPHRCRPADPAAPARRRSR